MRLALKQAETAFLLGEIPVGAVLVVDNEVVTAAHNTKERRSDPTAHAELIVIREGSRKTGDWRLEDATLYATKEPCVMCAGAMVNARLGRLVYGCEDRRFGAATSRYQIPTDPSLNHRVRVVPGVLRQECSSLLKRFFQKLRSSPNNTRCTELPVKR